MEDELYNGEIDLTTLNLDSFEYCPVLSIKPCSVVRLSKTAQKNLYKSFSFMGEVFDKLNIPEFLYSYTISVQRVYHYTKKQLENDHHPKEAKDYFYSMVFNLFCIQPEEPPIVKVMTFDKTNVGGLYNRIYILINRFENSSGVDILDYGDTIRPPQEISRLTEQWVNLRTK